MPNRRTTTRGGGAKRYRSARTGRIVTKSYADRHRSTTVAESVKKSAGTKKGTK